MSLDKLTGVAVGFSSGIGIVWRGYEEEQAGDGQESRERTFSG